VLTLSTLIYPTGGLVHTKAAEKVRLQPILWKKSKETTSRKQQSASTLTTNYNLFNSVTSLEFSSLICPMCFMTNQLPPLEIYTGTIAFQISG